MLHILNSMINIESLSLELTPDPKLAVCICTCITSVKKHANLSINELLSIVIEPRAEVVTHIRYSTSIKMK